MSEFDLEAARAWLDANPTVTAVNVNAYVAALDEISRIRPVYEAAKAMQVGVGGYDRAVFKRINAVCVAVETAEDSSRGRQPDKHGRNPEMLNECRQLTNDEIIDVRDALLAKGDVASLSVPDQNLYRDCDIALGVVRCKPETREEARARVSRLMSQR